MACRLIVGALLCAGLAAQAATVYGPVAYTSAAANPVAGVFSYGHLETFEDGLLNTPGVTASGGVPLSTASTSLVDSVDADDGSIDGNGSAGHSYYSNGLNFITFTFSAASLGGSLPSVVGLAFTDVGVLQVAGIPSGVADATFEAFDDLGNSLGAVTLSQFGDGAVNGATAEDRFLAIRNPGGISRLTVGFATSGDWEVDHLFYALDATAVPEPASLALFGLGLGATWAARRRRFSAG